MNKKIALYLEMDKIKKWLIIILMFSELFFFANVLKTRGECLSLAFFHDQNDSFMDFFNSIVHSSYRNPYDIGGIYPPITYLFYYLCSRFFPEDLLDTIKCENLNGEALRSTQEGSILVFLYLIVSVLMFCFILLAVLKKLNLTNCIFVCALMFSAPILYAFERGNIIVFAILFSMYFIMFYNEKNPIVSESALIMLGIAANIKIYPAIFGMILLKEKKWNKALRCFLYGVLIYIIPLQMLGGMSKILTMFFNIVNTSSDFMTNSGFGWKVGFKNTCLMIEQAVGGFKVLEKTKVIDVLILIFFILACVIFFLEKEKWKSVLLLCLVIVGIPSFSFNYSIGFFIIPILVLLNERKIILLRDLITVILVLSLFLYYPYGQPNFCNLFQEGWPVTLGNWVYSCAILGLLIKLILEMFVSMVIKLKTIPALKDKMKRGEK